MSPYPVKTSPRPSTASAVKIVKPVSRLSKFKPKEESKKKDKKSKSKDVKTPKQNTASKAL